MLRYLPVAAVIFVSMPIVVLPTVAHAQAAPSCDGLMKQWVQIEKNLAANLSDGLTDNSAPRATLRALENLEGLAGAEMLYAMMKDNKCALPKMVPLAGTYLSAALRCDTERLRQRLADIPECKRENWQKSE